MIVELGTAPAIFDVDVKHVGEHTVVSVAGELDLYTAPTLRNRLLEQSQAGHHTIIVDLSQLEFTDSSGLGVLIGAYKRALGHYGAVCVLEAPDRVVKMLRITGLVPKVFRLFTDLQEALDYLDELPGR